jgi:hypothetical protein
MMDSVRGCRGAQGRSSAFIAVWCHDRGGKAMDPYKA